MRNYRESGRGPGRVTPLGVVGVVLAVVFVIGAGWSLATDDGRWSVVRMVVALLYAGYAVWFLLRARRRDRAAAAGRPPGS